MKTHHRVNYLIDRPQRLIVTVAVGVVGYIDILDHQDRLLADPDFNETFDQIINTIPCTQFDLSEQEALRLAQRRIVGPRSKRAFVAIQPHIYGLGRMMVVYHERLADAKVFRILAEALEWLGKKL